MPRRARIDATIAESAGGCGSRTNESTNVPTIHTSDGVNCVYEMENNNGIQYIRTTTPDHVLDLLVALGGEGNIFCKALKAVNVNSLIDGTIPC